MTAPIDPALGRRWLAAWERLGGAGDGTAELREVAARYSEPARHYHTLDHIACCVALLDEHRDGFERADEAELALWLHDVVYDPRASNNEARSAELAERMLQTGGVAREAIGRIAAMIMATAHAEPPRRGDESLVCDIDLAVLGSPPERYAEYVRLIGAEYAWVPAPVFRMRRAAVLRRFLRRPVIYASDGFRKRYEAAARKNLSAELTELER